MVVTKERAKTVRMKKDYPTFDCDAHVIDPKEIWEFAEPHERELVKSSYWQDGLRDVLNDRFQLGGP